MVRRKHNNLFNKGDLTNCNNWRRITLLPIPNKLFRKILIDKVKAAIDNKLRKEMQVLEKDHRIELFRPHI